MWQYMVFLVYTQLSWSLTPGPEVIKLFSCSTQLRMKFVPAQVSWAWNFPAIKYQNANNCWHFNIYLEEKFHAQLSWAWQKFYNLEPRKLSLFASVMIDEESLEHEIALQQLVAKNMHEDSWFMQCNALLHKYGLPNAYRIRDTFKSKMSLKEAIQTGVDAYVTNHWQSEDKTKTTLKYLNIAACVVGRVYNSWSSTSNSVRDVRRAQSKTKKL